MLLSCTITQPKQLQLNIKLQMTKTNYTDELKQHTYYKYAMKQ